MARVRCSLVLIASLLALGSLAPGEEPLSGAEANKVAKAGQAVTALVELKERRAYGSAFCIHPGGLFLTSAYVASGATNLILSPGQKDEQTCKATVLRSDAALDLALLRVEGVKNLPTVPLGPEVKLTERTEVVAVGYPFGEIGAVGDTDEPRYRLHVGGVTSLPRGDATPPRFEFDANLNPGHSGGPIFDRTGKVVGMAVGRVPHGRVSAAIPASALAKFVSQPVVVFDPPRLEATNVWKPYRFEARVLSALPDPTPFEVRLSLKPPRGPERSFAMEPAGDGKFTATAVPLPPATPEPEYRLLARFDNGLLDATTADRTFKVKERELKLGDVREVRFGADPAVVLANGETVSGAVTGLGPVPVRLGGHAVPVALEKAAEVQFAPAVESDSLWVTVVVRQGGKEVLRHTDHAPVRGLLPPPSAGPSSRGVKAPPLEGDRAIRKLDGPVADVAVGGAGRYLVLHLPTARRLDVFDVTKAEVVGSIPAEEADVKFAAGLEDVAVVRPRQGTLERWTLKTCERDVAVPVPVKGFVLDLALGSASRGPLLVRSAGGAADLDPAWFTLVDLETLKARGPDDLRVHRFDRRRQVMQLRASTDGKVFALWSTNQSPNGIGALVTSETDAKFHYTNTAAGHLVPAPDGKTLFTGQGRIPLPPHEGIIRPDPSGSVLPACHGEMYLTLPPPGKDGPLTVHHPNRADPVATFADAGVAVPREKTPPAAGLPLDKRVLLVPDEKLLITIPASADRLILHRLGG